MKEVVQIVAAVAFTYAVCISAGRLLLDLLRVKLYRSEEHFFGFMLGSVCLSVLMFGFAAADLVYRGVLLTTGLLLIGVALYRRRFVAPAEELPKLPQAFAAGFWSLYLIFGCLYFVWALAPDVSVDANLYHVALPARYLRQHGFGLLHSGFRGPDWMTRNMMADLPEGIEMLFLFAFAFGKHSAAALVHWLFTMVTPLGILSYARRAGFPIPGLAGALLFFLSPIVGILGASGYVDVAVAAVVFAAFYAVQIWREQRSNGWAISVGLLAGFAFTAKYTAFLAAPYVLGVMVASLRRKRAGAAGFRQCLLAGVCALVMMAPWMLKNWIVAGNPVAPFGNAYFPNPHMHVASELNYQARMKDSGGMPLRAFPLELSMQGERLQGLLGPVFLLAPLALLALRTAMGRQLLLAGAVFLLTYPSAVATRFLVPCLPFLSLALAMAFSRWPLALAPVVLVHAVLSWPSVMDHYTAPGAWRLAGMPWEAAFRREPDEAYLSRNGSSEYDTGEMLQREIPEGLPVFSFHTIDQAHQSHEVIVAWQSAFGSRIGATLTAALPGEAPPVRQCEISFPSRKLERIRLINRGVSEGEWGVSELRIFSEGRELPRALAWRIGASPNSWDVPLAFDNNPVTSWVSGQAAAPGMFVEIDFGRPESVDRMSVLYTSDQPPLNGEVGASDGGAWATVPASVMCRDGKPPARLRRAAIEVLKTSGISWILIQEQDPGANDFFKRQAQWGITLIAVQDAFRLYRLD